VIGKRWCTHSIPSFDRPFSLPRGQVPLRGRIENPGDPHLVQSIKDISGRSQIQHGGFNGFVTHPMLNGARIEAGT